MIYLFVRNENRWNIIYLIKLIELPNIKGLINCSVKRRKRTPVERKTRKQNCNFERLFSLSDICFQSSNFKTDLGQISLDKWCQDINQGFENERYARNLFWYEVTIWLMTHADPTKKPISCLFDIDIHCVSLSIRYLDDWLRFPWFELNCIMC